MKINKKVSLTDIEKINLDAVIKRAKENMDNAIFRALEAKKAAKKADKEQESFTKNPNDNNYLSAFKEKFKGYSLEAKKDIFDSLKNSIGSFILYKAIESLDDKDTTETKLKTFYDFADTDNGMGLPCAETDAPAMGIVLYWDNLSPTDRSLYLKKISEFYDVNDTEIESRCGFFERGCKDRKYHTGKPLLEDSRKFFSKIIYNSNTNIEALFNTDVYILKDTTSFKNTVDIHDKVTRYDKEEIKSVAQIICNDNELEKSNTPYYELICPFVKGDEIDHESPDIEESLVTNFIEKTNFDSYASEMGDYLPTTQFLILNQ